MKGIRADAPNEAIEAIVRALASVLAYPITKVRKVTKRTIFFDNNAAPATPAVVLPVPVPVEPEVVPVVPAPVPEPADPENPVWEASEEAKFAFALLVMYLLWIGFRTGRSPPWGVALERFRTFRGKSAF